MSEFRIAQAGLASGRLEECERRRAKAEVPLSSHTMY